MKSPPNNKPAYFPRGGIWFLVGAAFLVAALTKVVMSTSWEDFYAAPAYVIVFCAVLYLLSHLLRAVRLAMLAVPILNTSFRTTALLHLATAPFTILAPFKLAELFRLHQLYLLRNRVIGAVLVVLFERVFDALILLVIFLLIGLTGAGLQPGAEIVLWMTIGFTVVAVLLFTMGPNMLVAVQRHILINHRRPRARLLLRIVDMVREATSEGNRQLRQQGAQLMLISVMIWTLEALAIGGLGVYFGQSIADAPQLLTGRIMQEWQALMGGVNVSPVISLSAKLSVLVLVLVWPIATILYVRRAFAPRTSVSVHPHSRREVTHAP